MPIYEYKCASCEAEFEYMQRITEDPKRECESCGGGLERLISQTSFQLKGSGWYRDLYSSKKPDGAQDGAAKGAEASGDGKAGKSDDGTASKGDAAGSGSGDKAASKAPATAGAGGGADKPSKSPAS